MDSKFRLIMPSKFRDELGERFIMTRGLDKCILVYTLEKWESIEQKVSQMPMTDADVRKFMRYFIGGAAECEPDSQGRFLVPANLREHASLVKDVISVGLTDRIEVWSKEVWDSYDISNIQIDNSTAEKMQLLGGI